jgi:hypothetical protein
MKNHLDSVDFHFQDGEGSMGLFITITKSAKASKMGNDLPVVINRSIFGIFVL